MRPRTIGREPLRAGGLSTRTLLVCGALAAVQTVVSASVSAVTPGLAAMMPPAYALVAALHTIMPFLARLLTGAPWTATITSAITGVLVWPFSAVGPLMMFVFLAAGLAFDLALRRPGAPTRRRLAAAAVSAGVALFLVSLPVFSPAHLVPGILAATLAGRLLGEGVAVVVASALVKGLRRVGVRSH